METSRLSFLTFDVHHRTRRAFQQVRIASLSFMKWLTQRRVIRITFITRTCCFSPVDYREMFIQPDIWTQKREMWSLFKYFSRDEEGKGMAELKRGENERVKYFCQIWELDCRAFRAKYGWKDDKNAINRVKGIKERLMATAWLDNN